ncbi:glutaminase [Labilibaculum euxinus]|uniref:Glutaminase n=1 Tax=Labilibaculum euxinus TaxID=2686357 RepID=A0A7M4D556_9BACT|nr:glutaminase [Labilibaculum euxinus]MUP37785.1 glutaminase [Labilibaculum euxinus]MVB06990.1 glutaminase [Labilibaculum euxinus]
MEYQKIFTEILKKMDDYKDSGSPASYIPELRDVDPDKFGVHLITNTNQNYSLGDSEEKFSIQSISKVLSLVMAYKLEDEDLWKRVGVEPSGTPFNSLVQLEYDQGIPRNPFINAGALVICDVLVEHLENPKEEFLHFVRTLSGNSSLEYCSRIAESEKLTSYRNAALINLMKDLGNIRNDIDTVLDFYFNLCSIEMTCSELARTFLFLASYGKNPITNEKFLSSSKSKRINAVMQLCGFYDEAGEFSFKVGLPGKSGVGGGIVAILPNQYSIAVWSPRLNKKGNSSKGMKFLELFTSETESSIF